MDRLRIFDARNAESLAADLFRECFNSAFPVPREKCGLPIPTPPEKWHQFVAVYTWPDGSEETVGFLNFIEHGELCLGGGMCVKKTFYKRLPREAFNEIKSRGGVAQMLLEQAARDLAHCDALFGYCGDAKALAVDLRAGYEKTSRPYVLAKWLRDLPEAERQRLVERVAAIGPF